MKYLGPALVVLVWTVVIGAISVVHVRDARRECNEEVSRANRDKQNIIRLAAGGWEFKKDESADDGGVGQLERQVEYLEKVYAESVRGRQQSIEHFRSSVVSWDKQINKLYNHLHNRRKELDNLKKLLAKRSR